jgi:hypothetical protein
MRGVIAWPFAKFDCECDFSAFALVVALRARFDQAVITSVCSTNNNDGRQLRPGEGVTR